MADDALLAAINAGIDGTDAPASTETPAEETTEEETSENGTETPAEGEETTEEAAEKPAEGQETVEKPAEAPAAGTEQAKKPADAAADPAKAAEQQPAKSKDHINDPIDGRLKADTRERITSLVGKVKELSPKVEEYDQMMGHIQQSGATPEQYSQALQYIGAVNSGDPRQIEAAINFMQQELVALGRLLGKPVQGVDFAHNHADLTQAVAEGKLTPALAQEIAVQRDRTATISQNAQRAEQQQQQAQQERQTAIQGLNTLGQQLAQQDPSYGQRSAAVMSKLQAKGANGEPSLIERTPPSQWQTLFLQHYAVTQVAPAPAASRVPAGTPAVRQQPLRARQPAGAGAAAAQPNSLLAAVNAGIDNAR